MSSPTPSGVSFATLGLPDALVQRLRRDDITTPFPIQAAAIPDALSGRDVLGRGQTGSGKTLAFGLPVLARLAGRQARSRKPLAVVLVPTRELAMQVHDALMPLGHVVGVRLRLIAGGMPYVKQIQGLERGTELVIATPGRLADLVERGSCDLSDVDIAVLDEADHMAEMGFLEAITELLDLMPADGQRLLFSATLDRGIDGVVDRYLDNPVTHATESGQASVTTMSHHVLHVEPNHKAVITAEIAAREGRTVVFVRTKLGADRVAGQLRSQGVAAAALHGGLAQGARNAVLTAFRDGALPVLVATDVAARGIHVDDIGLVLQVDPPQDHKDYLHRAGRTARAGGQGTVVTLALPHQRRSMERLAGQAGVEVVAQTARPGDAAVAEATGARRPEGPPLTDEDIRRITTKPRRERGGRPGSGPRRGPRREWQPRDDRREDRPRREWQPRGDRTQTAGDDRREFRSRDERPRRTEGAPRREWQPREGGPRRTEGGPRREWQPREGGPRRTEGGPRRTEGGPRRTGGSFAAKGGPKRPGPARRPR